MVMDILERELETRTQARYQEKQQQEEIQLPERAETQRLPTIGQTRWIHRQKEQEHQTQVVQAEKQTIEVQEEATHPAALPPDQVQIQTTVIHQVEILAEDKLKH